MVTSYANRTTDRYSLRSFFAFDKLTHAIGMETATRLVFAYEARAIMVAVRVSTAIGNEDAFIPEHVGIRYDLTSHSLETGE